jgi:hypothetical protein
MLPHERGGTLVVANHQHEVESPVVVGDLTIGSRSWRNPIFTASSRRMWEPGFFAERIPWLRPLLRNVNLGALFAAIGMQPIENELHSRPFVSIAHALRTEHGSVPVAQVFREVACARLPESVHVVNDLLAVKHFAIGREYVSLNHLFEPYRGEALAAVRSSIDTDLAHFDALVRSGGTLFLTPEGFYSGDGKMQRLRGMLARLMPIARVWIVGISYDPFAGKRLSMLYRVMEARADVPIDTQLKAIRPVTTSALLGTWLRDRSEPFTFEEACANIQAQLAALPPQSFVDPALADAPAARVRAAIRTMLSQQALRRVGDDRYTLTDSRKHPGFPRTDDTIAYQANFHAETLEGIAALNP